jgi:hypothetical protein
MHVVDEWADLAAQHAVEDDAWEYLRWTSERLGYDCWPSPADAPNPARDAKALLAFRRRYNQDVADLAGIAPEDNPYHPAFTRPLNLRGALNREDWRAFFEMMQKYFVRALRTPMSQLLDLQTKLNFGSEGLGCGESHPFDREERERRRLALYPDQNLGEQPRDRRVEIVFLDPDEAALLPTPMLCHPKPDAAACKPELCMLYDQKLIEFQRLSPVPQKGKIEIIERTVMRDNRLFTDEEQVLVEEASGDFTPILGEKVRILVRVTPPYTPFEGTLRLAIGRRTKEEEKLISRVAVLHSMAENGDMFVTLTKSTLVVLEWDGLATEEVPREYSNRQIHDEIQDKMVFIPMMEMKPDQRAKHGPYVIEIVQLFAKDGTIAAQYAPDEDERDELTMVVQVVVDLIFTDESWKVLNAVGFGDTREASTVPFVQVYRAAVALRTSYYLRVANHRLVVSPNRANATTGLRVELDCAQHWVQVGGEYDPAGGEMGPSKTKGETNTGFRLDGGEFFGNLFLWYEEFSSAHPNAKNVGNRVCDIVVYSAVLLEETMGDEGYQACISAFGRVGFPADRRMRWVRAPKGAYESTMKEDLRLFGGPNAPRVHGEDGVVVGQVQLLDQSYIEPEVDPVTGLITLATTNVYSVPVLRALDIQRALNAVVGYAAVILAHELGHLLGATASPDSRSQPFPMPDASGTGPYMNQDEGEHDRQVTLTGLMVAGEKWPRAQLLGVSGSERSFAAAQRAYLMTVLPRASDFVVVEFP